MKNILLKLDDKAFFQLMRIKNRVEYVEHKDYTWEEFIIYLKAYYNRN